MKKLFLSLALLLVSSLAFAQGGQYTSWTVNSAGAPVAATVQLCSLNTNCTPVTQYTDQTLSTPASNPNNTDSSGNFSIFAPPGFYTIKACVGAACLVQNISVNLAANAPATVSALVITGTPYVSGTLPAVPPTVTPGQSALAVDTDGFWKESVNGAAFWVFAPGTIYDCGTTSPCTATRLSTQNPIFIMGQRTLTGGNATVGSVPAFVTSSHCFTTDRTDATRTSRGTQATTIITLTGTGTDVIDYFCFNY